MTGLFLSASSMVACDLRLIQNVHEKINCHGLLTDTMKGKEQTLSKRILVDKICSQMLPWTNTGLIQYSLNG